MLHTIRLAAELAAPRVEIYAIYLDARTHAAITGAPVTIAPRAGAAFEAFDGALSGQILHLVAEQMIVQTWRSNVFKRADADSILILTLLPHGRRGTLLDLQQVNVPDQDYAGASQGWELYYFAPWRDCLTMRSAQRARKPRKAWTRLRAPSGSAGEAAAVRLLLEFLALGGDLTDVIPAKAGIHFALNGESNRMKMEPRFRGDDTPLDRTLRRITQAELVAGPCSEGALSGSHTHAPGSAGRYLVRRAALIARCRAARDCGARPPAASRTRGETRG